MMRIPIATYRIQFNPSFSFQNAEKPVAYLSELGISDTWQPIESERTLLVSRALEFFPVALLISENIG